MSPRTSPSGGLRDVRMSKVKVRFGSSGGRSRHALLLSALAVPVLMIALYFVFNSLESKSYTETRGEMDEAFVKLPTVQYNGRSYAQKLNMTSLLLLGVDKQEDSAAVGFRNGGQADFLLLLVMDHDAKIVRQLQIDRDTMTQVVVLGVLGNDVGTRELQICLSHAYGANEAECAAHAMQAVQNLLEGMKIDGCLSLKMSEIGALNAALGGVEVTLEEDLTALDPAMKMGATLTLSNEQAELLVRSRSDIGDGTNVSRMARQRAFMVSAVNQILNRCREDASFAEAFLNDMQAVEMYQSLTKGRLVNEASRALGYEVRPIETLPGEHRIGADGFMEFHADGDALVAWVMDVFYRERD